MNTQQTIQSLNLDAQLADLDKLGILLAQIAELEEQAEVIKNAFKNAGEGKYEGKLYKAAVSLSQRNTVDYKSLVADLGISEHTLAKYTKTTASIAIRVTSR